MALSWAAAGCAILPPPSTPAPGVDGFQIGAQHPLVALGPARARVRAPDGTELDVEGNGDVRGADFMLPLAALYAPRLALDFAPTDRLDLGVHVGALNAGAQLRKFEYGADVAGSRMALSFAYQFGYPIPKASTIIPSPHEIRLMAENHPAMAARWAPWFAIGLAYGRYRHSLKHPAPPAPAGTPEPSDTIDIGRVELRFEVSTGVQYRLPSRRGALLLLAAPYVIAHQGRATGDRRHPGSYEVIRYQQRWGASLTLSWLFGLKAPVNRPAT